MTSDLTFGVGLAAGFGAGVLTAVAVAAILVVLGIGQADRALSDPEHALDGNSPFFDYASGNGGGKSSPVGTEGDR